VWKDAYADIQAAAKEGASTGQEDPGAGNQTWLPKVEEESRLARTVAIEGLFEVLRKGVIT